MNDSPDTRPVPSMKRLEASALQLIEERILSKGGKMPSDKALAMTVQALAAKAHRELTAQQNKDQGSTVPERVGLKISPSSFNQRVTGDW